MKTIEMVRNIREKQAKEIENKSRHEIIVYFRNKAKRLHKRIEDIQRVRQSK